MLTYQLPKVCESPTLGKFGEKLLERGKGGGKGKERQGKRGKMERLGRKIVKGKEENSKMEGEKCIFFYFVLFFCFVFVFVCLFVCWLVCFCFSCPFLKPLKLVCGVPK